jgi:DNA-binding NtrC family response regulator
MYKDIIRVLFIEDSRAEALAMSTSLAEHGIVTSHYTGIAEVLFPENSMAALLDLNLNATSGVDTLLAFQRRFPHMPVVIVTEIDNPHILSTARKMGVHSCHCKAVNNSTELSETVAVALRDAVNSTHAKQICIIDATIETIRSHANLLRSDSNAHAG